MTELILGAGLPTSAAPGDDPVALAQEAERLGFDFVSAPDHPCGGDLLYGADPKLATTASSRVRSWSATRSAGAGRVPDQASPRSARTPS